jgi:hypothetical protein
MLRTAMLHLLQTLNVTNILLVWEDKRLPLMTFESSLTRRLPNPTAQV